MHSGTRLSNDMVINLAENRVLASVFVNLFKSGLDELVKGLMTWERPDAMFDGAILKRLVEYLLPVDNGHKKLSVRLVSEVIVAKAQKKWKWMMMVTKMTFLMVLIFQSLLLGGITKHLGAHCLSKKLLCPFWTPAFVLRNFQS